MSLYADNLREFFNHNVTDEAADEIDNLEQAVDKLMHERDQLAAQNARLVGALEQGFPLLSDEGLDEVEHHCEWVIQRERKRVHSILAAYRKKGAQP